MINPDLIIPAQLRRVPGDRDGPTGRRFSSEVEAGREAHRFHAACKKLNQKARKRRARERRARKRIRA